MMKSSIRNARGYTLIELIIVVSIIALLASIAVPAFLNFAIRAKMSERNVVMRSIANTVLENASRDARLPVMSGALSVINAPDNPPAPYSGTKKTWVKNLGDWVHIGYLPDGNVYFHYSVVGVMVPGGGVGTVAVTAISDLDGDTIPGLYMQVYHLEPSGLWMPEPPVELPSGEV
ncbi:MAG: type IV pilin protein [Myxococcaceae bacterium]